MMDDSKMVALSYQLIQKDFKLNEENRKEEILSFEELKVHVARMVAYLLDKDMGSLLNILYRIDVGEDRVKYILANSPAGELANNLTDAIIEREKVKAAFRLKYAADKS